MPWYRLARWDLLVMLSFAGVLAFSGRAGSQPLKGSEILARVEALYNDVNDYTVTLDIVADLERLNIPPMHVTMYFKKPNKLHFDAEGFAILPREGLGISAGQLSARYTVERVDEDTLNGAREFRLTLTPKDERAQIRKLLLYVNPVRWTPDKGVTSLPDGRTMSAAVQHEQVDGRWMPSLMTVTFTSPVRDTTEVPPWEQVAPAAPIRRASPRNGTITVRYSDYRINTGLSDDIFSKETSPAR